HHVGLVLLGQLHDFGAVGGPGGHLDLGVPIEQRPQTLEHDRVVVGEQHPDHGATHSRGSVTVSAVPRPGALSSANLPPSIPTRSWMPRNPKCPPSTPTSSSLARTRLGSKPRDRKSTRLNSSHQIISYAVF